MGVRKGGKNTIRPACEGRAKLYVPDSLAEQGNDRAANNVPGEVEVRPSRDGKGRTVVQDMDVVFSLLVFIGPPQVPEVAVIFASGRTHGKLTLPCSFLKYLFAVSQQHLGVCQRAAQRNEISDPPGEAVVLPQLLPQRPLAGGERLGRWIRRQFLQWRSVVVTWFEVSGMHCHRLSLAAAAFRIPTMVTLLPEPCDQIIGDHASKTVTDQDDALIASQLVVVQSPEESETGCSDVAPRLDVWWGGSEITGRVTDVTEKEFFGAIAENPAVRATQPHRPPTPKRSLSSPPTPTADYLPDTGPSPAPPLR